MGVPAGARPVHGVRPGYSEDSYQQVVIDWYSGWAVVSAAAGSGKSHCLVERTASLLARGEVPESICLLVYNADAAKLLRERLKRRVGPDSARLEIRTFHAWCYVLLRYWYPQDQRLWPGHVLGGSDGPSPYKVAAPLASKLNTPVGLALRVAEKVAEGLHPATFGGVADAMGWEIDDPRALTLAAFLKLFQQEKRDRHLIDFGDMLAEVATAIQSYPDNGAIQALTSMYRHVMVDECQDSSLPRAIISRWLGQRAESLLCVGDPCQSIAGHAGARLDLFMELATAPGVTVLTLPVNRRSTRRIVEAANEVSADQPWNLSGDSIPRATAPQGEPIQIWETGDAKEEAVRVIEDIQRRVALGAPLDSHVCLLRTNALIVEMEYAFVARGIPVRVAGSSGGVWGSAAGTEMLAYLEAIEGVPTFSMLAIANKPNRFLKKVDLGAEIEQALLREKSGEPVELHGYLQKHASKGAQHFGRDLEKAATLSWKQRCKRVVTWLTNADEDDEEEEVDEDRKEALEALGRVAQDAGSLAAVYKLKKEASRGQREPAVLLSTIHKSKGQEYPTVYGCSVRLDALPHKRCSSEAELEEERRLLYVLVTRARDTLVISTGGKPSRFLRDLKWVQAEQP
jgi:DNA helicase-2/ATP-dependent DNA helicase PcrA